MSENTGDVGGYTRRRFLGNSASAGALLVTDPKIILPDFSFPWLRGRREQAMTNNEFKFADNRFYNDLDRFTFNHLEVIRTGIKKFGKDFEVQLRPLGYEEGLWNESVDQCCAVLGRIHEAYVSLEQRNLLGDSRERERLQDCFYELGSALWAIGYAGEIWGDRKDQFNGEVSLYRFNKFRNPLEGDTDLLIGNEILSIYACWANIGYEELPNQNSSAFFQRISPVIELLTSDKNPDDSINPIFVKDVAASTKPGFARIAETFLPDFPVTIGISALPGYSRDYLLDEGAKKVEGYNAAVGRPKIAEIRGADQQVREFLLKKLEQLGISRTVTQVSVEKELFKTPIWSSAMAYYEGGKRGIHILSELLTKENLQKYPQLGLRVTFHEFAHAVIFLARRLGDPVEAQALIVTIRAIISTIRSYPRVSTVFEAKEEPVTPREIPSVGGQINLPKEDAMARTLTGPFLTNYPTDVFLFDRMFLSINEWWRQMSLAGLTKMTLQKLSVKMSIPADTRLGLMTLVDQGGTQRLTYQSENFSGLLYRQYRPKDNLLQKQYGDFSAFYYELMQNRVSSVPPNSFEAHLMTYIEQNINLFDRAFQRWFYPISTQGQEVTGGRWLNFFFDAVIPTVLADLVINKEAELEKRAKENADKTKDSAIDHLVHDLKLHGKWVKQAMNMADEELWAEAFSAIKRWKDTGVKLDRDIDWQLWEKKVEEIMRVLVANGVALKEDEFKPKA